MTGVTAVVVRELLYYHLLYETTIDESLNLVKELVVIEVLTVVEKEISHLYDDQPTYITKVKRQSCKAKKTKTSK